MRIVLIGTGDIGVPTLQSLQASSEHELVGVVTQPDKVAGRAQTLTAPAIKVALSGSAIPILQPDRIKNAEAIEQIREWKPDVIVVIAYGQILPRAVLELPRVACLNLHASLLPRHRGAAPIQAAIVAGDRETGITVIYMDEGLDTGDILLQSHIDISPNETGGSLHDRLAQIAPRSLSDALQQLPDGNAARTSQNSDLATYAPKLEREHGRIDWNESVDVIERKIRAFNPWPGAFIEISVETAASQKLKIFNATIIDRSAHPAGEILDGSDGKLLIGTKDGVLSLNEVQLEGKRRMSALEFLRGFSRPFHLHRS